MSILWSGLLITIEVPAAEARVANPTLCLHACTRKYRECSRRPIGPPHRKRAICGAQRSACNTACLKPPI
jgi:hypothetical protein